MANNASNRGPPPKNVIYDSRKDTSTGGKRAVDITGGVSVAERARLFGTQVTFSSVPKPVQNSINKPPIKSNNIQEGRNYQRFRTDNNNQYPKQNSSYSTSQKPPNNYQSSSGQTYDRPNHAQPSFNTSREYSTVTRSHNQQRQRSIPNYDSTPPRQRSNKQNYTQITSGELYTTDDDSYYESYNKHKVSPPRNTNYFQPIQDPLEVLYKNSPYEYSQQTTVNNNNQMDGMQSFDLGNLINRIQQDYLNNARPYVSSIQYIESEQNLSNIGLIPSSTNKKDYSRRSNDIYLKQGTSYHYDVIDTSSFYPGYSIPSYNNNYHNQSMRTRRHRRRYHDQASSPIHFRGSISQTQPPPNPPTPPIEKPSTPVEENDTEEEETTTAPTHAEENKTTEAETSSEEEEEEEEESTEAPAPAPITTAPPAIQRNEITQSTPAKQSDSETNESSESESDSDSDTDSDSDDGKKKKKPPPTSRSNPVRTTPATPQSTTRGTPQRTPIISNKTIEPPEVSNSVKSFDIQDSKKSPGIVGKFKSITNKFRRQKS